LSNWVDLFQQAIDQHIPKLSYRKASDHPWIDAELRIIIHKKDKQRRKGIRSQVHACAMSIMCIHVQCPLTSTNFCINV
jgi:hypothetical protein